METPSVNGVASALRRRPWKTTPADAKSAPTAAPASVRGSLAMKKICASVLSANGIEKSKARASAMRVGPISGANDQRRAEQGRETDDRPEEALLQAHGAARRAPASRDEHAVARRVSQHFDIHAVDVAHVLRRQRLVGAPCRDDLAVAHHDDRSQARRRARDRASRSRSRRRVRRAAGAGGPRPRAGSRDRATPSAHRAEGSRSLPAEAGSYRHVLFVWTS